ncbi:MAG TPA: TolC family protein, partial [Dissulfurispiraceae bacterium]
MRNNKDRAMEHKVRGAGKAFLSALCALLLFAFVFTTAGRSFASEGELRLRELIDEALRKSPEILASQYRADASQYRIPQAQSLPDPMFMFGYQNEGWSKYTWGDMQMSWWMFSASQMVPFPGKLSLKGEMASKESESLRASYDSSRLKVIMKVKELYYDLFLGHKNLDLLKDRVALFSRIEDAATARYSSGMGPQQDVLMAQTEKYMLLEKEEMQKQKIQSLEAMLNSTIGREVNCPLGRPTDAWASVFVRSLDELLRMASENSPEVRAKERMVGSSETKVRMAEKEYYPDFTFTGNVMKRRGEF